MERAGLDLQNGVATQDQLFVGGADEAHEQWRIHDLVAEAAGDLRRVELPEDQIHAGFKRENEPAAAQHEPRIDHLLEGHDIRAADIDQVLEEQLHTVGEAALVSGARRDGVAIKAVQEVEVGDFDGAVGLGNAASQHEERGEPGPEPDGTMGGRHGGILHRPASHRATFGRRRHAASRWVRDYCAFALNPSSIGSSAPFTKRASSESRNTITPATSEATPIRPWG